MIEVDVKKHDGGGEEEGTQLGFGVLIHNIVPKIHQY